MSENEELRLDRALAGLRDDARRAAATEWTGALLLNAFRRRRRERRRAQGMAGAAAACLLLAVPVLLLRSAREPVPAAARSESAQFIPVAYAEPLRPGEPARVVAVRMPRGALIQLGLPVNPERLSERIEAQVLLGEDNLVRAVRFVH